MELKCNNANANSQAQIDQLKGEVIEIQTQLLAIREQNKTLTGMIEQLTERNDTKFRALIRYEHLY